MTTEPESNAVTEVLSNLSAPLLICEITPGACKLGAMELNQITGNVPYRMGMSDALEARVEVRNAGNLLVYVSHFGAEVHDHGSRIEIHALRQSNGSLRKSPFEVAKVAMRAILMKGFLKVNVAWAPEAKSSPQGRALSKLLEAFGLVDGPAVNKGFAQYIAMAMSGAPFWNRSEKFKEWYIGAARGLFALCEDDKKLQETVYINARGEKIGTMNAEHGSKAMKEIERLIALLAKEGRYAQASATEEDYSGPGWRR